MSPTGFAPVQLAGLGTALPPHRLDQAAVAFRLAALFPADVTGGAAFARTIARAGIATRWSVRPLAWFDAPRSWEERSQAYLEGAGALFLAAARAALDDAGWTPASIDGVVTVSSTGIATPTLEARCHGRLGLRSDVQRVPLFGLGCAGGVTGFAVARRLAAARPGSRVLLVVVETCSLSFRSDRPGKADLVASLLFGDGAAAACIGSAGAVPTTAPCLDDGVEHLWPDSLDIMGWSIDDGGFGVVFDRSIPAFVTTELRPALERSLDRLGLGLGDVDRLVCHPGGTKVLEAIEATFALGAGALDHERTVLSEVGNMSAPTVLFVLERMLRTRPSGTLLLTALGPGFTASFLPIRCGA